MSDQRFDLAVIGGGAVGTAAARAAAEDGASVVLLEAGSIGNGSTAKSAGMFRRAFATESTAALAARSVPIFEDLEQQEQSGIGLHQPGYVVLGEATHRETLQQAADNAERSGARVERYDRAGCEERVPKLQEDEIVCGVEVAGDGYTDPYLVATTQARLAADAGADVRTNAPVTDLDVQDGQVRAIDTEDGEIAIDAVVNASGVWSPAIAELAGIELPVDPVRTFVLTSPTPLPDDHPMVLSLGADVYYRDEPGGGTLIGGPLSTDVEDPDAYDGSVGIDLLLELGDRAARVDARFADLEIESSWAGLKAVTPDGLPILGAHPDRPNLVHVAGFNGHGFMLSPAAGEAAATIALGEDPTVDVGALSPSRLDTGTVDERTVEIHLS